MNNTRILIFTNHFLPGNRAGGPVTSIANLTRLLNDDFEITIVTSNKDLGVDKPYNQVEYDKVVRYEAFNIVYLSIINTNTVLNTINDIKPDLIYLNSFFSTFTQLVLFLFIKNKFETPIILAPRGELQENALAIKAFKKKVYLTVYKLMKMYKKVYFHVTDKIEYDRTKQMFGVENISILPNVPKVSNEEALSKNKNELKLIFISRIRDNKNLLLALQALAKGQGNIIFDIYGPIEDNAYWEKCQVAMKELPNHVVTEYKGIVEPTEISNVMRKYHALLLPTKTENFGHVIVEAMQTGVVPIISDQTPWVDLVKHNAGWDLDLAKVDDFTQVINTLYEMDEREYSRLSGSTMRYISKKLNIKELKRKYIALFERLVNEKI